MKYALVTGGSKGIGFGIAKALARRNYQLILVARNAEALESAKQAIEDEYRVTVKIIKADLLDKNSCTTIANWCNENKIELTILCNVAGIGGAKDFLSVPLNDSLEMLQLNTVPAISLTHSLLPLLQKNSPSFILNTSSMAGFAPIAAKNIYSASKSAILFFSYSLRRQLKNEDISVSCLCPGPVFTKPSIEADTIQKLGWLGKQMAVTADYAGEIAIKKTLQRKLVIVPGVIAYVLSRLITMMPAGLINSVS
jgi:uncharacterized protein